MKIEVERHWNNTNYFVIVMLRKLRSDLALSLVEDGCFYDIIVNIILKNKKEYEKEYNMEITNVVYFSTEEDAKRFLNEILLPYIMLEKISEE